MSPDATVPYISRFIDPYNPTIVIVQLHYGINVRMQSSCRVLLFKRQNVLNSFTRVKFYHGLGSYDYGYFKGNLKPTHKVTFGLFINKKVES